MEKQCTGLCCAHDFAIRLIWLQSKTFIFFPTVPSLDIQVYNYSPPNLKFHLNLGYYGVLPGFLIQWLSYTLKLTIVTRFGVQLCIIFELTRNVSRQGIKEADKGCPTVTS